MCVNCGGSGKIQIYGIDRDWVEEDCEWCSNDDQYQEEKDAWVEDSQNNL